MAEQRHAHTHGETAFGQIGASLAILLAAGLLTQVGLAWNQGPGGPIIRISLVPREETLSLPGPSDNPKPQPYVHPDRARAINAAVPFSNDPLTAARPFRFAAIGGESFARARDCLASAAWYEAGDDRVGQQSVVQVILNRVMHPAFPKTVCGVVYQGSNRVTGCQFTFTCDGSMYRRTPSAAAWARARGNAERALAGLVDPTVGLSTHYHTDWVAPYWSGSLTKIARVGTHLFFRFPGRLGKSGAFQNPSSGMEPLIGELAALSPAHGATGTRFDPSAPVGDTARLAAADSGAHSRTLMGNRVSASDSARRIFALQLNMQAAWASYAKVARTLCENRASCTVMGWAPETAPSGLGEFQARRGSALFVYRKSGNGAEQAQWDCRRFLRPPAQCLPGTTPKKPDLTAARGAEGPTAPARP